MDSNKVKENKIKHYIVVDQNFYITNGFSIVFEEPKEQDICICEDGGRHFELNGQINPALRDLQGAPLYKWDGTKAIETTDEERQEYIQSLKKKNGIRKKICNSMAGVKNKIFMRAKNKKI